MSSAGDGQDYDLSVSPPAPINNLPSFFSSTFRQTSKNVHIFPEATQQIKFIQCDLESAIPPSDAVLLFCKMTGSFRTHLIQAQEFINNSNAQRPSTLINIVASKYKKKHNRWQYIHVSPTN